MQWWFDWFQRPVWNFIFYLPLLPLFTFCLVKIFTFKHFQCHFFNNLTKLLSNWIKSNCSNTRIVRIHWRLTSIIVYLRTVPLGHINLSVNCIQIWCYKMQQIKKLTFAIQCSYNRNKDNVKITSHLPTPTFRITRASIN